VFAVEFLLEALRLPERGPILNEGLGMKHVRFEGQVKPGSRYCFLAYLLFVQVEPPPRLVLLSKRRRSGETLRVTVKAVFHRDHNSSIYDMIYVCERATSSNTKENKRARMQWDI
jgi:hypothetical protein